MKAVEKSLHRNPSLKINMRLWRQTSSIEMTLGNVAKGLGEIDVLRGLLNSLQTDLTSDHNEEDHDKEAARL